jgi:hypothetical protein
VLADLHAIEAEEPARLTITWDETLRYPRSVELDRIAAAIDDEWSMRITNFRRLD